MQTYRLYIRDQKGRITAPPTDEVFASDEACRSRIAALVTQLTGAEAWCGSRLVCSIPAT